MNDLLEQINQRLEEFLWIKYPDAEPMGKALILDDQTKFYATGIRKGQLIRNGDEITALEIASTEEIKAFLGIDPPTVTPNFTEVTPEITNDEPPIRESDEIGRPIKKDKLNSGSSSPKIQDKFKTLPNSEEAEKAVLGAILLDPDKCCKICNDQIESDFFYAQRNRYIYDELIYCWREGTAHDLVTLTQYFYDSGKLNEIGGGSYLAELYSFIPTTEMIEQHIEILREKHTLRQLITSSRRVESMALDNQEAFEILESVRKSIEKIEQSTIKKSGKKLSVRTITELFNMEFDEKDNYFGDRVIAQGQSCTLLGPGGIGKSRLVMQMAVQMIIGSRFLGMDTFAHEKKWLFLQTENNNRRLHKDLQNLCVQLRLSEEEVILVNKSLFIHTIETEEDVFLDLTEPSIYKKVSEMIQDINPQFVEFDPLNSMTTGELNGDQDMRAVCMAITRVTKLRNPNRVPLVIHHSLTGKAGAAKAVGWDKASYGRNSKVLQAWTRSQINIAPRDPDNQNLLVMACGKNNNGKHFDEIGIIFDEEMGIYRKDDDFNPEQFREDIGLNKPSKDTKFQKTYSIEQIFEVMSKTHAQSSTALGKWIVDEKIMSTGTFWRLWKELVKTGRIEQRDGGWVRRSG